jgi:structural maintenance of chromosome 3 (chondroitin sulfate proteoglycan 6)
MNIKKAIIEGFKSYKETIIFGLFSPSQNCIIGFNGSGKSNFYKAIEFDSLDEHSRIR